MRAEVDMTLRLTEEQLRAVQRGEPVRLKASGLGELILLRASVYDENRKGTTKRSAKKMPKLSNARLKALAVKYKPPQSWHDEKY
jgi:hypothetical protein